MSQYQTRVAQFLAITFIVIGTPTVFANGKQSRPNILIILADDLGYGDLACYGNKTVKTPNLDRLAREGMRLTSCYAAAANCSPSRAGLMTGRTPTRLGIHNWIPMLSPMHLQASEITIATLLRRAGYATAQIGKWHLCGMFNLPGQPQPGDHGFDYWMSTQNNALPNHRDPYNFVGNKIPLGPIKGFSAQIVADAACRWLTKARDPDKPFFLHVCFHEPHEPIASDERFRKLYPFSEPSKSAHHGNITQMDAAVGAILKTLSDLKLDEDTLIIFTSDNGPAITVMHPHGSAGVLRDKKGTLYEGGIRVPGILRWKGRIPPGKQSDVPVCGIDVLPTLCELTGVAAPKDRVLDGTSFAPLLDGKTFERQRPLYWHFNAAANGPQVALRDGDWMLLAYLDLPIKSRGDILPEDQKAIRAAKLESFELYNLKNDIGQKTDLAAKEPKRVKEMSKRMAPIYAEVCAESPTWPAWTFPRYEGGRIEWPAYWKKKKGK